MNLLKPQDLQVFDVPNSIKFIDYLSTKLGKAQDALEINDFSQINELTSLGITPNDFPQGLFLSGADPDDPTVGLQQTLESMLYELQTAGNISAIEDPNASNQIKNNGFLTMYYIVRKAIDAGPPVNPENILKLLIPNYDKFVSVFWPGRLKKNKTFSFCCICNKVSAGPCHRPKSCRLS